MLISRPCNNALSLILTTILIGISLAAHCERVYGQDLPQGIEPLSQKALEQASGGMWGQCYTSNTCAVVNPGQDCSDCGNGCWYYTFESGPITQYTCTACAPLNLITNCACNTTLAPCCMWHWWLCLGLSPSGDCYTDDGGDRGSPYVGVLAGPRAFHIVWTPCL
jgi:hypothetical protein